jgi:hypothetical protein
LAKQLERYKGYLEKKLAVVGKEAEEERKKEEERKEETMMKRIERLQIHEKME